MFIKIYFRKSFVQQLERSFDKSAQNFLLKIRSFSAQRHNFFFSKVFFLIRSMHLLKHLRNRSFKVRKKFVQRTEPLSTIFLSNYSKEVVEWNFGIPYKTNCFCKARKICPHIPGESWTFCSFGHLQCRFHNLPETSIQTPHFEKNYPRMWYRKFNLQF